MHDNPVIEQQVRSFPVLVALFILGTIIGLVGTFFALLGTQAATGNEPFLPTLLEVAAFYVIVWSIAGLIVSMGFRGRYLKLKILGGFVSGGLVAAFMETLFIVTLKGGDFTLFVCLISPPAIGFFGVQRAIKKVRKENNPEE